jgi:hypothetical protein
MIKLCVLDRTNVWLRPHLAALGPPPMCQLPCAARVLLLIPSVQAAVTKPFRMSEGSLPRPLKKSLLQTIFPNYDT